MKVIFVAPRPFSLAYGGLEVQFVKTKCALKKLGIEVETLDYFRIDQIRNGDIVHFFGAEYAFFQMTRILIARGIPYVVSPVYYLRGIARLAGAIASRIPRTSLWMRRAVLEGARWILPNSQAEKDLILRMFALDPSKIRVVPNGVDEDFVGSDPLTFRRMYLPELPLNEPFVLSVGRIERRKNSINLLRAAARLKVPIVFIGQPVPQEQEYVKAFFKEFEKYPGYCKHIPFLPNNSVMLPNAYAAAQVHALVSFVETPGLASLEAGLNGANLVVGYSPPVMEYFSNIAWVVDQQDVTSIKNALEEALATTRDGKGQRAFILSNFTWDIVGLKTMEVYNSI